MPFRVAHISDLHFDRVVEGASDSLLDSIGAREPDAVVLSGDFTMAGTPDEYRSAEAFVRRIGAPIVATPGNHDIPAYALFERFFRPLRRYRRHIEPWTLDRLVLNGCAMLSLNTARPWDLSWNWSHGRFSHKQIDEADAFFAEHSSADARVLVAHHPFYVPEDLPGFRTVGNGERMLAVLARRRVSLVLTGHLHRQDASHRDMPLDEAFDEPGAHRVYLVQASTATSERQRDQPNAYNWIEIGSGRVALTPMVLGESGRFEPEATESLPVFEASK
ncbi:MAG: metallophosphoesterase [Phycisphaerales bacterium]|nr:MAG: metallophosphoesterase [Phycisphaerales bacterium]